MESADKEVKIIFVLVDGIADVGHKKLDGKTALQAAKLPIMDALARSGLNGLLDPVETGLACGSDTAHMNIFGYNPFKYYRGRGSFEAMGAGISMDLSDIAFKCNFATLNPDTGIVEKRRVDREFHLWGLPLIDYLDGKKIPDYEGYTLTVKHATEHRCGVKVSGPGMTDQIIGTDPLKDNLPLRKVVPKDKSDEKAVFTAKLVQRISDFIFDELSAHPINKERVAKGLSAANIILLRGCGSRLDVPHFDKLHGLRSFMIAPTAIISGLGQTVETKIVKVAGATGDYHTDLNAKARACADTITSETANFNYGFVHVKAVDDAGHDKDLQKKVTYLEKVNEMLYTLLSELKTKRNPKHEYIFVLTGDHTTPISIGDHTFEPVCFAITSYSALMNELEELDQETAKKREAVLKLKDSVQLFNEIDAAEGSLGRFPGCEVMTIIKSFRNLLLKKLS